MYTKLYLTYIHQMVPPSGNHSTHYSLKSRINKSSLELFLSYKYDQVFRREAFFKIYQNLTILQLILYIVLCIYIFVLYNKYFTLLHGSSLFSMVLCVINQHFPSWKYIGFKKASQRVVFF